MSIKDEIPLNELLEQREKLKNALDALWGKFVDKTLTILQRRFPIFDVKHALKWLDDYTLSLYKDDIDFSNAIMLTIGGMLKIFEDDYAPKTVVSTRLFLSALKREGLFDNFWNIEALDVLETMLGDIGNEDLKVVGAQQDGAR